jgi:hypothetical protein
MDFFIWTSAGSWTVFLGRYAEVGVNFENAVNPTCYEHDYEETKKHEPINNPALTSVTPTFAYRLLYHFVDTKVTD